MSRNWHHERTPQGLTIGEGWSYTRRVVLANPTEKRYHAGSYVITLGAWTRVHCYADSLDDALGTVADWAVTYAPGYIVTYGSAEYNEMMADACADAGLAWPMPRGADPEPYYAAEESAFEGMPLTELGWLDRDWSIGLENPTTDELYAYICGE